MKFYKKLLILPLMLMLVASNAFGENYKGWKKLSRGRGGELPAPGLKLTPSTVPTHSDLANGVIYYKLSTHQVLAYINSSWVDLGVQAGAGLTLDGAFDNGKIINGASSLANAVQIGDGTDAILIHTEAAGDVRITTNGTSDLTIAPDGGDTDITGTLDVSGAFTSAAQTVSGDVDITPTDTTGNGVYIDASTITTGNGLIVEVDSVTLANGYAFNLTQDAASIFSVAEDGDTLVAGTLGVTGLATLGSATISTGGLTISAGGLTVTGDNIFTAAATTGNGNYFDGTTVTTGDVVQIEYDATNLNTGLAINVTEDTATVWSVGEDGNTTISGTAAGTTALSLTAGDLVVTSGYVDISGAAGAVDLVDITRSNTATNGDGIDINMGSAAVAGDGIDIAWAGAGTGDSITINQANNVAGAALNVASSGARTGPLVDIASAATDAGADDHVINILQSGSLDSDIVRLAFGTANSPGDALSIDMDTNLAGTGIYIDEGAGARTGPAIQVNADGTGTHSVIDLDISGNAAITGLDITGSFNGSPAGDLIALTLDDGDNLDTALINASVGTGNRGALIQYVSTGTDSGTTSHVIDINQTGVLDSNVIDITYDTGVSTGNAIDINMGSNVAGHAIDINSSATGVNNEGTCLQIVNNAELVQGANVMLVIGSGNMAGSESATFELAESGNAQAGSAAFTVNSTNNYAIEVLNGSSIFGGNKILGFDSAVGQYSQADTFWDWFADGGMRFGDSSAGAPTNYSMFGSDGTLTFTGTARLSKKIYIPATAFALQQGTPAAGLNGYVWTWDMDKDAAESVVTTFYVPDNWVAASDIVVYIHWSSTAVANDCVWDGDWVPVAEAEAAGGAGTSFTQVTDTTDGTANDLNVTAALTITGASLAAGDQVALRITRLGADGSDTLAVDAQFHGVLMTYTANKP